MEIATIVLFYANAILFIILMRNLYLNERSVIINGLKKDNKELSDSLEIKKRSNTRMVTRIAELERQVYDLSHGK